MLGSKRLSAPDTADQVVQSLAFSLHGLRALSSDILPLLANTVGSILIDDFKKKIQREPHCQKITKKKRTCCSLAFFSASNVLCMASSFSVFAKIKAVRN